jgi:pantothenate kinase
VTTDGILHPNAVCSPTAGIMDRKGFPASSRHRARFGVAFLSAV